MIIGVDLSRYQVILNGNQVTKPINFDKLKAAGVKFAFVRATTIDGQRDWAFDNTWAGLKSVGIPRGAYGFANQDNPMGYAVNLHRVVSATGDLGELPPVLDFEYRYVSATKSYIGKMTDKAAKTWLDAVESLFGKRPIIYTSKSMWFNPAPSWTASYPLWVASYTTAVKPTMPAGWAEWVFWQYKIESVGVQETYGVQSKEIDMDRYNGTQAEFNVRFGVKSEPTLEERVADLERRVAMLEVR
jgi:GH25 family lysozyme M1 (1,4-beta-N-acetylmuramidase)